MFRLYGRLIPRNRKKQNQPLSGGKERGSRPFFSRSGKSAALRTGRERLPFPSGVCGLWSAIGSLQSAVCSLQEIFFPYYKEGNSNQRQPPSAVTGRWDLPAKPAFFPGTWRSSVSSFVSSFPVCRKSKRGEPEGIFCVRASVFFYPIL